MGIGKYYTQDFEVYSKNRSKDSSGAWEESLVLEDSFKGILDPAPTAYSFTSDKETFFYSDKLFTAVNGKITEDRVIRYKTTDFDVVSVQDPLYRSHHAEVLLNRRKKS